MSLDPSVSLIKPANVSFPDLSSRLQEVMKGDICKRGILGEHFPDFVHVDVIIQFNFDGVTEGKI